MFVFIIGIDKVRHAWLQEGMKAMQTETRRQPVVVKAGQAPELQVLGAGVRFVCEAEQTNGNFSVMVNDLPFGSGPPPHHHAWDEGYFLISGTVDFVIDGLEVRGEAGDFLLAPAGTIHTFSGSSRDPARILVIDAPAHAAAFFRQVDREVTGDSDLHKVPAIGAAHGVHFVGR